MRIVLVAAADGVAVEATPLVETIPVPAAAPLVEALIASVDPLR